MGPVQNPMNYLPPTALTLNNSVAMLFLS